jgi:hypothetical protein
VTFKEPLHLSFKETKMKRAFWFVLFCCLVATPAFARKGGGGQIGLGLAVGDPTGLTLKFLLTQSTAFDLFIGEDFEDGDDDLQINFDWLFSPVVLGQGPGFSVPLYFGLGGVIEIDDNNFGDDDIDLGIRAPLGVSFLFNQAPIELFIEVALEIIFIDDNNGNDDVDFDAVLGFRYYF